MAVRVAFATLPPHLTCTDLVLFVCSTCSLLRHAILTVVRTLTQFVRCVESENVYRAAIFMTRDLPEYILVLDLVWTYRAHGCVPVCRDQHNWRTYNRKLFTWQNHWWKFPQADSDFWMKPPKEGARFWIRTPQNFQCSLSPVCRTILAPTEATAHCVLKSRRHLGLSLSFKQCQGKNEWNLKLNSIDMSL